MKIRLSILRNTTSLFSSDVVNRGATFVVFMLVARHLGTHEFGQIALAISLVYMFHVLSILGLTTFVTREIARQKDETSRYLLNSAVIVTISSLLSITGVFLLVRLMGYPSDTSTIITLLSLSLLPNALSKVCEAVFRAWERMQYITYAAAFEGVMKVLLAFLLLRSDAGLTPVVIVLVLAIMGNFALQLLLLMRNIELKPTAFDFEFCIKMLKRSVPFLGIESIHAFTTGINTILLSKFAGESAVGLYTAAVQLQLPVKLICQSVVKSIFPIMCRTYVQTIDSLKQIAHSLISVLLAITVPASVCLFLLANTALLTLFGSEEFQSASDIVRIMTWTMIFHAFASAFGNLLLASNKEKANLRIVITNAVVSFVFGLAFVSQLGLVGAALSSTLVAFINVAQHYFEISRLFSITTIARLLWKPLVAGLVIGGLIFSVDGYDPLLVILLAGVTYVLIVVSLAIVATESIGVVARWCQNLLSRRSL